MAYKEYRRQLRNHALMFHHALLEGGVYISPLGEKEFLSRIDEEISLCAKNIEKNIEDLELALLGLPVELIMAVDDVVPCANWDYESGYKGFFEDLDELFSKINWKVDWEHEPATSTLKLTLNNQTWSIENVKHIAEVDGEVYSQIMDHLNSALNKHGKELYEAVTGDQTGLLVLIPTSAREMLADYLISGNDPRAMSFYE